MKKKLPLFQMHLDSFKTSGDRWAFAIDKQITPEIVGTQIRAADYEVQWRNFLWTNLFVNASLARFYVNYLFNNCL